MMRNLLANWLRYFGPPKILKSDQEGAIKGDEFALTCERYSIHRHLAGSDGSGTHTSTGLAEAHIKLVKTAALKKKIAPGVNEKKSLAPRASCHAIGSDTHTTRTHPGI